jgi:hypothetical protein
MARTNLPLTTLTPNSAVLNSAGTAIDATNGMNIQMPTTAIPAAGGPDTLILYVQNTFAGTKTVTVRAGVGGGATPGQAFRSGLGDLTTGNLNASTGTAFVGPFDVARFVQLDGSVNVDFAAGTTGTVWAVLLPKRF